MIRINAKLTNDVIESLNAGDEVLISGTMYVARDTAHKKLVEMINRDEKLPFGIEDSIIYYAGPAPSRPGQVMNSIGPTSSYRMDSLTEPLLKKGLKGMIGKGSRSDEIREMLVEYNALYFIAVGGAAALIAKTVVKSEVIAFEEFGTEALRKIEVIDFPCIVAYDTKGKTTIK